MEIKLLSNDYSDLRNKTILDYTDNQKVIEDIVGMRLVDKDEKEYYFDNATTLMRAQHILNLSKKAKVSEFVLEARKQFSKILNIKTPYSSEY